VQATSLFFIAATAVSLAGCKVNPICINCGQSSGLTTDLGPSADLSPLQSGDGPPISTNDGGGDDGGGPCVPTNNGVEKCDHIDNDCNGVVDDVSPESLVADPNNCGSCFNECNFLPKHQFGTCVGGFDGGAPACKPSGCLPGYIDLDNDPTNGCEYACTPTSPATEICDGVDNDCDGVIDNGFGYPNYALSANNCGSCGHVCNLPGAVSSCAPDGTGKGACVVSSCVNDQGAVFGTFKHNPAAGNINTTGCEYHCPFPSSTPGDCNVMSCTFPPESCNSFDDDCNFVADDNPTDVGGPCSDPCPGASFVGACAKGTYQCQSGIKLCTGTKCPKPESCNGVDDNCDGKVDEPYTNTWTNGTNQVPNYDRDTSHCGACNSAVCNLPHASAQSCSQDLTLDASGKGVCKVIQCASGFAYAPKGGVSCAAPSSPENGPGGIGCYYPCPVNPVTAEVCDGKDNDCSGCPDDNLTAPLGFCSSLGVCSVGVTPTCNGASGWRCNYLGVPNVDANPDGSLKAAETKCDGLDNNCNGVADTDGFPQITTPTTACSDAKLGECQSTGFYECNTGHTAVQCHVTKAGKTAVAETCDGKDNDCDGIVDNSTGAGRIIDDMVHITGTGVDFYIYRYEASRPDANGATAGTSNVRPCSNPNVLPWSNVSWTDANAACMAVGKRLCTETEWQRACQGAAGRTYPYGNSFVTNACNTKEYDPVDCNPSDANGDVDQALPTATKYGCPPPATSQCISQEGVYDLSGNVKEWTSTQVSATPLTYRIRGGAFNNIATGASCTFAFDLDTPDFAFGDLGFRCCSNSAP
jgi:hypothetical protein